MADIPPYFHPRPPLPADAEALAAFDALFATAVAGGSGGEIAYELPYPRWQFLCYLADTKNVLLHGSGNPDIEVFEPRKANDVNEFGDRQAVYAASDGLWPMYFAILDRDNHPMSLINGSFRIVDADGTRTEPFYFFSITDQALRNRAFRNGTVYILPAETFEAQPLLRVREQNIHVPQWASPEPVRPLARLRITPEDFPFLEQMRGHDDTTIFARARANPDGFPWLDE